MTAAPLRVLITGASIAGPMAAYWFARAGASVVVVERAPALRPGGQAVDVRTVGVSVMRRVPGMEEQVRAKKTTLEEIALVGDDGRPFASFRSSGDTEQQALISEFEIYRGDLSQILYDLTKDNDKIRYVFNEQVASITQDEEDPEKPVSVGFANGLAPAEFDLVVACDGATSRTRALGLECGVRDHLTTLNSWAAYFSIPDKLLSDNKTGFSYNMVGGRWLTLGASPDGHGTQAMLWGASPRGGPIATLPFREAAKGGEQALKDYIAGFFQPPSSTDCWKVPEVLRGLQDPSVRDFYATEMLRVTLPTLYRGRFALAGDAGYGSAFTGNGTSLAMAGAYLLAGEVGVKHRGDIAAGLKSYDDLMRPILKDLTQIPPGFPTIMAPQTAWGIRVRDALFYTASTALNWGLGSLFSWVGGYFASALGKDKHPLPEYQWPGK